MSDDLAWVDEALCAQTDPELFFPEVGQPAATAKKICNRCDVRAQCLAYALQHDWIGVWGGLSRMERLAIRRANGLEAA